MRCCKNTIITTDKRLEDCRAASSAAVCLRLQTRPDTLHSARLRSTFLPSQTALTKMTFTLIKFALQPPPPPSHPPTQAAHRDSDFLLAPHAPLASDPHSDPRVSRDPGVLGYRGPHDVPSDIRRKRMATRACPRGGRETGGGNARSHQQEVHTTARIRRAPQVLTALAAATANTTRE